MEMAGMREEMRKMKEKMVGLEMSQSMLISHHKAHTALLEQHRQTLTTLTFQPPTPSDRRTPSGDRGAMEHLSMPLSQFSSSPIPTNSNHLFPFPPCPSPDSADHFMSPFITPRSSRVFNDIIHPGMLELNKLRITPSPMSSNQYHRAGVFAMEEESPVAGPSCLAQASVQQNNERGSPVVALEAAMDAISEEVGSGGSSLIKEEEDEQPRMVMPRIM
jgi:hypothetical protein